MNDGDDESPKMDSQMTARVDKMLLNYKTSRSTVAASDENVSPNTRTMRTKESETTPDMPPEWAQKIAALRDKIWELELYLRQHQLHIDYCIDQDVSNTKKQSYQVFRAFGTSNPLVIP